MTSVLTIEIKNLQIIAAIGSQKLYLCIHTIKNFVSC